MALDKRTRAAIQVGRRRAVEALKLRAAALKARAAALDRHPKPLMLRIQAVSLKGELVAEPTIMRTAGMLVAEGDSWFDYPSHDVLKELRDRYGYSIESVARSGDPIEEMAYGGDQLVEFTRKIENILGHGVRPKAVLLSGGGNDVAGKEFGMLVNHVRSKIAGLNDNVLEGVINQRIRTAYVTILTAVTEVCKKKIGQPLPILIHGYDYPVPDGRGYLFWGPWLEPGFREKGYPDDLPSLIRIAHDLIERFNAMLAEVSALEPFRHVRYINLRNTLSTSLDDYKDWWDNELHPSEKGWSLIADRFAAVLKTLP